MPRSIGSRLPPDEERIARDAARPDETTAETLRRAVPLLDQDRCLEQLRTDAGALEGEDLSAGPDAC